ncbi:VWA domain-containing protein [Bremerella sp. JC770]|uniref:vWA domain-containing protein n=1 Tax=Bremerella sp. JC770 TaxID=3232137 RepID=UPI0034580A50
MFAFDYPWLFLLLPLAWLVRSLPPRRVHQVSVRVPFGNRLAGTIGAGTSTSSSTITRLDLLVMSVVWLLVVAALARPVWIEPPITKQEPTRDMLLLVDLSGSMQQEDFKSPQGKSINRLTAAKEVLGDFLEQRQGDRVGLVVFGDAPYLQAPFSTDLELSRQLLDQCEVGMAGPRTALGDAIGLGINLFDKSEAPAKTMIALTDGNDTKSQLPPIEAARVAAQRDIRIHTVAIGDPTTVGEDKLDEQALRDVATETGGKYFFAADRKQLQGIYAELDKLETREVKTISHRPRNDIYYVPVLIALLISVAFKAFASYKRSRSARVTASKPLVLVNPATGKLEVKS